MGFAGGESSPQTPLRWRRGAGVFQTLTYYLEGEREGGRDPLRPIRTPERVASPVVEFHAVRVLHFFLRDFPNHLFTFNGAWESRGDLSHSSYRPLPGPWACSRLDRK